MLVATRWSHHAGKRHSRLASCMEMPGAVRLSDFATAAIVPSRSSSASMFSFRMSNTNFGLRSHLKFRSFEAVEHRIAESPNELNLDVPN